MNVDPYWVIVVGRRLFGARLKLCTGRVLGVCEFMFAADVVARLLDKDSLGRLVRVSTFVLDTSNLYRCIYIQISI